MDLLVCEILTRLKIEQHVFYTHLHNAHAIMKNHTLGRRIAPTKKVKKTNTTRFMFVTRENCDVCVFAY